MSFSDLSTVKKIGLSFAVLIIGAATMGFAVRQDMMTIEEARIETLQHEAIIAETVPARGALSRRKNPLRGFLITTQNGFDKQNGFEEGPDYYRARIDKHHLGEVVAQVAEMSSVVAVIAASAREQAVSLREVSTAADQMDKVTQQNAAMVEETIVAAQSLSSETEELAGLVATFRTKTSALRVQRGRPAPNPRRAAPARPVQQMRTIGRGGAALTPKTDTAIDGWEEF